MKIEQRHADLANDLIDRLGGTTKVANMFGVKPPSVCRWRKTGIPDARMMYLQVARPELFAEQSTDADSIS